MKIVYSALKYDYMDSKRGLSFEHSNFLEPLKSFANGGFIYYPYDEIVNIGKKEYNKTLLEIIKREKPDIFFAFMFTDELNFEVLDEIKKYTISIAWFSDDHWRLWNYSRYYASHFTCVVTTWSEAQEIYAYYGIKNVIHSQWAVNPNTWRPIEECKHTVDVSFVGQMTPARQRIIKKLRLFGINVYSSGFGWPGGRVLHEEMVNIFSHSKINLNLNSPPSLAYWKVFMRLFFKRSAGKIVLDFWHFKDNLKSMLNMSIPQIKARAFEILGCRAFLISGYADDMDHYYENGKEIVYYDGTVADLVGKIRYYLAHDEEREKIANAGYERTLRENTYRKRFKEIFEIIKKYKNNLDVI